MEDYCDNNNEEPVVFFMCHYLTISMVLGDIKIPYTIIKKAEAISNVLERRISIIVPELPHMPNLTAKISAVSVFDQVAVATVAKE